MQAVQSYSKLWIVHVNWTRVYDEINQCTMKQPGGKLSIITKCVINYY